MFDLGIRSITKLVEGPWLHSYEVEFVCDCSFWTRYPESAYLCFIHWKHVATILRHGRIDDV